MKITIADYDILKPFNVVMSGRPRLKDIPYGPQPLMTYDEYPVANKQAPLVIFWYGGSWKHGRKAMYKFVGHSLQKMGAHAFVVDYPKYPQRVYPGFTDDALQAIQHIEKRFKGRQIILMGHSAGGNTALLTAMQGKTSASKVISVAGACTLSQKYWHPVFGDAVKKGLTDPRSYVSNSPTKLKYLLIHGVLDTSVSLDDSVSLNKALSDNKRDSQLVNLKLVEHLTILPLLMFGPLFRTRAKLKKFIID